MIKILSKLTLLALCSASLVACGDMETPNAADSGLSNGSSTGSSSSASTGTSTGASSSTGAAGTGNLGASNNVFSEFVKSGDTFFGPEGAKAELGSDLSGNAAAGSRFGGPDNVVGVMVVVRNAKGYMEVVNLDNKKRFPVVYDSTSEAFNVPTDTLGGKAFASLFVGEIASLTEFKFDHRTSPSPEKCNRYTATYQNTSGGGEYRAAKTGEGCRYTNAGV